MRLDPRNEGPRSQGVKVRSDVRCSKDQREPKPDKGWHGWSLESVLPGASPLSLLPTPSSLQVFFLIINVESRTRKIEGEPLTFSKCPSIWFTKDLELCDLKQSPLISVTPSTFYPTLKSYRFSSPLLERAEIGMQSKSIFS